MANYFLSSRHDLSITDPTTSDIYGFILTRDSQTGAPNYIVYDSKYLADQFFTGEASVVNMNPEEEIPMVISDGREGFGLEVADHNEPKRYYSSIGMDLRHKGMAIAGPTPTTIDLPTYGMVITDPGLETWTDANTLTNYTLTNEVGTCVLNRDTTKHSGTYSAEIAMDLGEKGYITQTLTTWNNNYQGETVTFKYWAIGGDAVEDTYQMEIFDGQDTTTEASRAGSTWTERSVSHTFNASATQCVIRLRAYCTGGAPGTVNFDGLSSDIPFVSTVSSWADFNDKLYIGSANTLLKLNGTGDGWTFVESFPYAEAGAAEDVTITDLAPFTDDNLYLACGTATAYQYCNTAETFTVSTADEKTYQYFVVVHATVPTMWGNDGGNTIRSTADPSAAGTTWSGTTTVGSSYHDITGLFTKTGSLYIGKEDMMYYLDSSGNVQNDLCPELEAVASSTSCKNTGIWQNKLYVPAGTQVLLEVDGSTLTYVNPSKYCTGLSEFVGRVQAVAHDEEWLYVIVNNSTKLEILAGRWETIEGTTDWRWHPIAEIPDVHEGKDTTNTIAAADASDLTTLIALLTELRADYNTHIADTTYHLVADATNAVTSAIPTDLASCQTINNELKDDYNAHRSQSGVHAIDDPDNAVTSADQSDQSTGETLANEIKTDFNAHLIVGIDCETAFVSSVYQKRMYVASTSSSDSFYYIPLPTGYGDITNDTNRKFKTDTYFTTPAQHGRFKSDNKAYYKATATLGHDYDADIYYELHYKKLGDSSWTDAGDFKGASGNRKPVLYLPSSPTTTMMWFKLVAKTDDTDKTPILLNFDCRAILYPIRKDKIFCKVRVGKEVLDKNGTVIKDKYADQRNCLNNIRDATWPVTIKDIDGTTRYVKPLPLASNTPWGVPVKQEKGRDIEWEYTLALQEVHLS